ncbi:hypothetical protein QO010_003471 [Caulobacter ginsengisoli]|uniref:Integrase n=1 Tax=Caulobacter ginsengisoli TaxID=400775 RepID=A0ABU0IUJ7_9CAUL|nr:hypothetical protein [Caulobacter ginsengisoli]
MRSMVEGVSRYIHLCPRIRSRSAAALLES